MCGGGWVSGGNKEGVTLKYEMQSLCVSCPRGEKPARQLHRGPRETRKAHRVGLKAMLLIRRGTFGTEGVSAQQNMKHHPSSSMRRPPDVCYLRKAHFRAKLNNEMKLTPIPPTLFHVSGGNCS